MNSDRMSVSAAGLGWKKISRWECSGPEKLRETPSLQAGPRSEELAGEASRASIASAIHTAHVKETSIKEEPVIRSSLWCQIQIMSEASDAVSRLLST